MSTKTNNTDNEQSAKSRVIQIPVTSDFAASLKTLAELDERSLAVYCRRVLQEHVERILGINSRTQKLQQLKEVITSKEENLYTTTQNDYNSSSSKVYETNNNTENTTEEHPKVDILKNDTNTKKKVKSKKIGKLTAEMLT